MIVPKRLSSHEIEYFLLVNHGERCIIAFTNRTTLG